LSRLTLASKGEGEEERGWELRGGFTFICAPNPYPKFLTNGFASANAAAHAYNASKATINGQYAEFKM